MSKSERYVAPARAMLLVAAVACGDPYLHTNPYDPDTSLTFEIVGPDTVFSAGESVQYHVHSIPALSDTAGSWSVDSAAAFHAGTDSLAVDGTKVIFASGHGAFVAGVPPLEPVSATVSLVVRIGAVDTTVSRYIPKMIGCGCVVTFQTREYRRTLRKSVVLMQRLVRLQARCPDTHACDTLAVGQAWSAWVDGFDALGNSISGLSNPAANPSSGPPVATFLSRDTTVATVTAVGIRAASAVAQKSGTTWIVATRGSLADSLQVVVR